MSAPITEPNLNPESEPEPTERPEPDAIPETTPEPPLSEPGPGAP